MADTGEYKQYDEQQRQSQYAQPASAGGAPPAAVGGGSVLFSPKVIVLAVLFVFALVVLGTGGSLAYLAPFGMGLGMFGFAVYAGVMGFILAAIMIVLNVSPQSVGGLANNQTQIELFGSIFMAVNMFIVGIGCAVVAGRFGSSLNSNAGACSAFGFFSLIGWLFVAFLAAQNGRLGGGGGARPSPVVAV
eukprot:Unigene1277_Nuclearia_a/m.4065 Unigene1277_Nuclearia_a/g.4065  ORF Unigene1277_Nuclearia_a/g.4065 Unigene1277_Nuclearia_a/m.4065 type:complete len:190 (+) Unigene1277_Nuclearia_a:145-714(+)